ncbi:hypothetical protein C8J57DRAFT_1719785 [Mycena rebaudengoi]|nr:hypothetical protein C8J57DRAFT_1719785 [Mycena rebaudengoi]
MSIPPTEAVSPPSTRIPPGRLANLILTSKTVVAAADLLPFPYPQRRSGARYSDSGGGTDIFGRTIEDPWTKICYSASTSSLNNSLSSALKDLPWAKRHLGQDA